ncbi:MAG: hypothetical protein ACXVW7_18595, partial [Trebonia sp.]
EVVRRLEARGVPTTVRDTRGREIDGACGQLAASTAPGRTVGPARRASAPIGLAPADSAGAQSSRNASPCTPHLTLARHGPSRRS